MTLAQQHLVEQEKQAIRDFKNGLTAFARTRNVEVTWDGRCKVGDVELPLTIVGLRGQAAGGIQVTLDRPRLSARRGMRPLFWRTRKAGWDFDEILTCLVTQASERMQRAAARSALDTRIAAVKNDPRWDALQTACGDTPVTVQLTPDGSINVAMGGLTLDDAVVVVERLRSIVLVGSPDARIKALVDGGKAIEAIKLHRELYGSSLHEAKTVIDLMRGRLS